MKAHIWLRPLTCQKRSEGGVTRTRKWVPIWEETLILLSAPASLAQHELEIRRAVLLFYYSLGFIVIKWIWSKKKILILGNIPSSINILTLCSCLFAIFAYLGPLVSFLWPTRAMLDFTGFVEAKLNTKLNGPLFIFGDKLFGRFCCFYLLLKMITRKEIRFLAFLSCLENKLI